eukprot:TRINITY_DN12119_c0_g2_i2.p1 TRINITY_DN12119_c0_g2~~TRINITY_DN12119_c0_g2_i2.p1  ORF type:complete len:706 (+),score=234.51 TRINITY_DN12119_c0_g2_i2:3031-5148(+)
MSKKLRQSGPATLAELQNLVKRDKEAYAEEFMQQYRHYQATLQVFKLKPSKQSDEFGELVSFLSAVAHCFPKVLKTFPSEIMELLEHHAEALDPELRQTLCRALILLRNKDMLTSSALLELFFKLFKCRDKVLRDILYKHVVSDIRRLNAKHKNNAVNKTLQNFMFTMLGDPCLVAARKSLDVMVELYNRGVWNDSKTVNVITSAALLPQTRIAAAAVRFFLQDKSSMDEESDDDDEQATEVYKQTLQANERNKKTGKRKRKLKQALKSMHKAEKKKNKGDPTFYFEALHMINDPQGFAEKLFTRLRGAKGERFEIRLMYMNLISRLIGVHDLFVLNFYPYLQRYLQPYQKDVTRVLTYIAQASHDLVPSETLESVLRTIADNFISERSSPEAQAVGLNSIHAICARCPLAMDQTLLEDLIQYKSSKHKMVTMGARALIQLYRQVNPSMLPKKERGKPSEHDLDDEALEYGEARVADVVPGSELLTMYAEAKEAGDIMDEEADDGWETGSDDEDDDAGDWVTVQRDDDKLRKEAKAKKNGSEAADSEFQRDDVIADTVTKDERARRAKELTTTKILTQEDFDRIKSLKARQALAPSIAKRKLAIAKIENDVLDETAILPETKKRKQDKAERLAQVMEGREDRGKYGFRKGKLSEHASSTNKDKAKRKNPMMLKYARKFREKRGRDIRTKQMDARKSREKDARNRK